MPTPILHGFPKSTYVWTARAALSLAGIEHEFVSIMPPDHRSASHLTRHPFGKVPSLTNPALYEAASDRSLGARSRRCLSFSRRPDRCCPR